MYSNARYNKLRMSTNNYFPRRLGYEIRTTITRSAFKCRLIPNQSQVSKQLYLTRQTVSRWENDHGYPDIDTLASLGKLYHVPVSELLECGGSTRESPIQKKDQIEDQSQIDHSRKKLGQFDRSLILLAAIIIISFMSTMIPFLGIILPFIILALNKKSNLLHKTIICVSVAVMLTSGYSSFIILKDTVFHPTATIITKSDR